MRSFVGDRLCIGSGFGDGDAVELDSFCGFLRCIFWNDLRLLLFQRLICTGILKELVFARKIQFPVFDTPEYVCRRMGRGLVESGMGVRTAVICGNAHIVASEIVGHILKRPPFFQHTDGDEGIPLIPESVARRRDRFEFLLRCLLLLICVLGIRDQGTEIQGVQIFL